MHRAGAGRTFYNNLRQYN